MLDLKDDGFGGIWALLQLESLESMLHRESLGKLHSRNESYATMTSLHKFGEFYDATFP